MLSVPKSKPVRPPTPKPRTKTNRSTYNSSKSKNLVPSKSRKTKTNRSIIKTSNSTAHKNFGSKIDKLIHNGSEQKTNVNAKDLQPFSKKFVNTVVTSKKNRGDFINTAEGDIHKKIKHFQELELKQKEERARYMAIRKAKLTGNTFKDNLIDYLNLNKMKPTNTCNYININEYINPESSWNIPFNIKEKKINDIKNSNYVLLYKHQNIITANNMTIPFNEYLDWIGVNNQGNIIIPINYENKKLIAFLHNPTNTTYNNYYNSYLKEYTHAKINGNYFDIIPVLETLYK